MVLEKELETYRKNKKDLLRKHNGKYVLIKGNKIINILESEKDLLNEAYKKFKNEAFLIKKISEIDNVANFANDCILICENE